MNREFSWLINLAADIQTSGKCEALNKQIEQLAVNPTPGSEWHLQVIGNLWSRGFLEYLRLKHAYERQDQADSPDLLAWRARNLLELSIWSDYCSKSPENARRFYEDAGRDVLSVYTSFQKWGTKTSQNPEWFQSLQRAEDNLKTRAEGIASLEGDFKRVLDAAVDCGLGEAFKAANKLLSKFAHPTALAVVFPPDEEKVRFQRDFLLSQGCLYFSGIFEAISGQLLGKAS